MTIFAHNTITERVEGASFPLSFFSVASNGIVELQEGYALSSSSLSSESSSLSSSSRSSDSTPSTASSSSSISSQSSSSISSPSSDSTSSSPSSSSTERFNVDLYVSPSGNDSNDGTSPEYAKATISNAIAACRVGRTVHVLSGTYVLTAPITIGKAITVSGEDPTTTFIDGNNTTYCMLVAHVDAVVEKFTIRRGRAIDWGPAGVGVTFGTVRYCIIRDNTLINLGASGYGGAGVYLTGVNSKLIACLVINNSAQYYGGGVSMTEGGVVEGCTIYGNSANSGGGGIFVLNTWYNTATLICNTIIYGNTPNSTGWGGFTNVSNYTSDPHFIDASLTLGSGDFRLQADSPCRNTGDNPSVTVSSDLAAMPRIAEANVDIGCYEIQS